MVWMSDYNLPYIFEKDGLKLGYGAGRLLVEVSADFAKSQPDFVAGLFKYLKDEAEAEREAVHTIEYTSGRESRASVFVNDYEKSAEAVLKLLIEHRIIQADEKRAAYESLDIDHHTDLGSASSLRYIDSGKDQILLHFVGKNKEESGQFAEQARIILKSCAAVKLKSCAAVKEKTSIKYAAEGGGDMDKLIASPTVIEYAPEDWRDTDKANFRRAMITYRAAEGVSWKDATLAVLDCLKSGKISGQTPSPMLTASQYDQARRELYLPSGAQLAK